MNIRERQIIRSLRDQSATLTGKDLPSAAVDHACREIHSILTLLTEAEQPYMKEERCHAQAEDKLHQLEHYLTRYSASTTLQKEESPCP